MPRNCLYMGFADGTLGQVWTINADFGITAVFPVTIPVRRVIGQPLVVRAYVTVVVFIVYGALVFVVYGFVWNQVFQTHKLDLFPALCRLSCHHIVSSPIPVLPYIKSPALLLVSAGDFDCNPNVARRKTAGLHMYSFRKRASH